MSAPYVRVEKGEAQPEELAALTAYLMARAAAYARPPAAEPDRGKAGWRRLERTPNYQAPHSWQG
ncbi:acyl-CoA carboxylase subunit epsilon [Streptomyces sp. NPDC047525]|uniref:acyl-CoA carboxylase subunit epsilon n=1 Tax=Streptomyces sp. NPDC047525 TaxID=3155264 RepID=UPI0033C1E916